MWVDKTLVFPTPGHTSEHSPSAAERRVNHRANFDVQQIKKCDRKLEWKEVQKEELHDLYCSPDIARVIQMKNKDNEWKCDTYGGQQRCMQGFGGEN
jgi:hypothetical protein